MGNLHTMGIVVIVQILSGVAVTIGGLIVIANWYSIYASYRSGRFGSPVPLVGGALLALGLLGFEQTASYYWLGPVVDYGTIILLFSIPKLLWTTWSTSSFNLMHRFHSVTDGRSDDMKLFKSGKFTINTSYDPPVPCDNHGALAVSSGQDGSWRKRDGVFFLEEYDGGRVLRIIKDDDAFRTEEDNYPDNQASSYNCLGSLRLRKAL